MPSKYISVFKIQRFMHLLQKHFGQMNRRTYGREDLPADAPKEAPSYRNTKTHLKKWIRTASVFTRMSQGKRWRQRQILRHIRFLLLAHSFILSPGSLNFHLLVATKRLYRSLRRSVCGQVVFVRPGLVFTSPFKKQRDEATKRLYKSVCPSIGRSVCRFVMFLLCFRFLAFLVRLMT